jgi:hypothetical protein
MIHPERVFQQLPNNLVDRARVHGERLAAHYASGGSPRSRARSGHRGTERNPVRLAQSKAATNQQVTSTFFAEDQHV